MIKLHTVVDTPNGKGLVQGRLALAGKPERILVSHDPRRVDPNSAEISMYALSPYLGGPWLLCAYPPEDVKEGTA